MIGNVVLGSSRQTRSVTRMTLMPTAFYLSWAALDVWIEVPQGLMTHAHAQLLVTLNLIGAAFYLWVRCGLVSDAGASRFVIAQIVFGGAVSLVDYLFIPTLRSASLHLVTLGLAFGFISLSPTQIRVLGGLASTALLAMLAALWSTRLYDFDPADEALPLLLSSVAMLALALIAGEHARLRLKVKQQTRDLRTTLAEVEWLATHDGLTGLLNRSTMEQKLNERAERSSVAGLPWSVALIDLDHFKQINDGHGHAVGDEALCTFARCATAQLRANDVLARWGGEEFLVLLDGAGAADGLAAIDRLRAAFATMPVSASAPELRVGFSAGIAAHRAGHTVADMVAAADAALYACKAAGRNRCAIAGAGSAVDPKRLQISLP